MNAPKITVIIPTRERCDVLEKALKTVTSQDYENLEIIVSDNFSVDSTEHIVRSAGDRRLRYINTGKRVSMSHNWEFALSHVEDGWVMIIGDDDGLLPGALNRAAEIIRATKTDAIIPSSCTFIWPNDSNSGHGRLLIPMRRGIEIRSSREWLRRVLTGRSWYSELPMLYAGGIINIDLIKRVRDRKGSFFQSNQPDIFSAVALACATDSYVYCHMPFAIAGHSKHSNGASWAASARLAASPSQLAPANKFFSEDNIPFHADIPLGIDGSFPVSDDLLVYESYLQAKYLHENFVGVSHETQLALFLSRRISDRHNMLQWARVFSSFHDLNMARVMRRNIFLKTKLKWYRMLEYSVAFFTFYRIDSSFGIRMRDVYEASLVADVVLRLRPSRTKSWVKTLAKWIRGHH